MRKIDGEERLKAGVLMSKKISMARLIILIKYFSGLTRKRKCASLEILKIGWSF